VLASPHAVPHASALPPNADLSGIGPWTAHHVALRALGHPDAFPADDLVLQKAVPGDGTRMTARALTERAQAWRPWRGYATLQLWRAATAAPAARKHSARLVVAASGGSGR